MKHILVIILTFVLLFSTFTLVNAQGTENIWLEATTIAYKTGEFVVVTVHANSSTPIQGFTFQIRYDPACLQPVNTSTPIPGMNGLSLPQTAGLVDATFASTTPQYANGLLAEVQFTALAGCQTNIVLENAGLAIRNAEGYAAQLPGVSIGNNNITLAIDPSAGVAQTPNVLGTPLALGQEAEQGMDGIRVFTIVLMIFLSLVVIGGIIFVIAKIL